MRKTLILLIISIFSIQLFSQEQILFSDVEPYLHVQKVSSTELNISIRTGQVKLIEKSYKSGDYIEISNKLTEKTFGNGEPMLPQIVRLVDVPAKAHIKIKSLKYKQVTIDLNKYFPGIKLLPATPSQRKDLALITPVPDTKVYSTNSFVNKDIISSSIQGWLRSYRIGQLVIRPFNYNPQTNELVIYTDIEASIEFVDADMAQTYRIKQRYSSPFYKFNCQIISTITPRKSLLKDLPMKLIIVYPDEFLTGALLEYKQWKERQGFDVVMAPLSQTGKDTTSIRAWLKNYYETSSHPQDFVLFIGDVDKVPSWPQRTQDQHVTDLYYCEYTGDFLPEVYWGRISADDTTELWNAIQKILSYEQLSLPNTSYLTHTLLVAGNDENNEDTYANGQVRYINTYYLNTNNGYDVHALYQDPPAGADYSDTIIDVINNGCALANYSAHCSPQGWADPSFTQADIDNNLIKNKLYGVWIANCCQSNKFDEEDAFSEVALYTPGKGVAAYIGASDYSYWDEDYWWAIGYTDDIVSNPAYNNTLEGAFDGYFHTMPNQKDPSTWAITTAQMVYAGNMSVMQSSSDLKQYYWEIYQVMGDPTLVPFVGTPQKLVITAQKPVEKGSSQVDLQTVPYTYLTVYHGDMRIGTGLTDSTGYVQIITSSPISEDSITVYAWGQNKIPTKTFIQTVSNIPIVDVSLADKILNSGTNDTLSLIFENTNDSATLQNVYAGLEVVDQGLLLGTDSVYIGTLGPNSRKIATVPCSVAELKDLSNIRLLLHIHQTCDTSDLTFYNQQEIKVYSPQLQIISFTLHDQNNNFVLDPSEGGYLTLTLYNKGHANFDSLDVSISSTPGLASFSPEEIKGLELDAQDTISLNFNFQCQDFSDFTPAKITAFVTAENVQDSTTLNTYFGQPQYLILSMGEQTTSNYPFNNYWKNGETQIFIPQDEAKLLDTINELAFRIASPTPNGYTLKNLTIGFYQTDSSQLTDFIDPSNFTTVYSHTITLPDQQGWFYFHTDSQWHIDPNKALVVYIKWGTNDDYVSEDQAFSVYGQKTDYISVLYKNYDVPGVGDDNVYSSYIRPAMKIGKGEISAVNNVENFQQVKIYPTPTQGIINISVPDERQVRQIQIFSLSGRLINSWPHYQRVVDVSDLQPGVYILQITEQQHTFTTKIIRQ